MSSLQDKFQRLRKTLNQAHLERKGIIDGVLATVLANQNALLYGPPGTGKSLLLREICESFKGAVFFQRLLHKAMSPDEVLGQISLKALEQDIMKRNTSGRIQEAHLAFLDEVYRGNGVLLNSMLELMNERTYDNPDKQTSPLKTLVGATNSIDAGHDLEAFTDRFIYRPWVKDLRRPTSTKKLLNWQIKGDRPKVTQGFLSLADLEKASLEANEIPVSDRMIEKLSEVFQQIISSGFTVSARRRGKLVKLAQSFAYIQGDDALYLEHIHELFPQCIWKKEPKEQTEISKIITTTAPIPKENIAQAAEAGNEEIRNLRTTAKGSEHDRVVTLCDQTRSRLNNLLSMIEQTDTGLGRNGDQLVAQVQAQINQQIGEVETILEAAY